MTDIFAEIIGKEQTLGTTMSSNTSIPIISKSITQSGLSGLGEFEYESTSKFKIFWYADYSVLFQFPYDSNTAFMFLKVDDDLYLYCLNPEKFDFDLVIKKDTTSLEVSSHWSSKLDDVVDTKDMCERFESTHEIVTTGIEEAMGVERDTYSETVSKIKDLRMKRKADIEKYKKKANKVKDEIKELRDKIAKLERTMTRIKEESKNKSRQTDSILREYEKGMKTSSALISDYKKFLYEETVNFNNNAEYIQNILLRVDGKI